MLPKKSNFNLYNIQTSYVPEGLEEFEVIGKTGKIIRLVRIMRILRIFKLVRHFAGLQSLIITLQQVREVFKKLLSGLTTDLYRVSQKMTHCFKLP